MKYILTVIALWTCTLTYSQTKAEKAIWNVLETQTNAWNEGNIDAYMTGYWNNDSLLFIGSKGPTYGYQNTLENYKKSYTDTAKMGKLSFSNLNMKRLSEEYCFVSGRWELKRSMGDIGGYFTLLFKEINRKWVIIADHSS